jgi:hypothetical protein
MALDDLPLSGEVAEVLRRLSAAYARVRDDDTPLDSLGGLEGEMYRASLEGRMRQLWQRARTELGRRYASGCLAPA